MTLKCNKAEEFFGKGLKPLSSALIEHAKGDPSCVVMDGNGCPHCNDFLINQGFSFLEPICKDFQDNVGVFVNSQMSPLDEWRFELHQKNCLTCRRSAKEFVAKNSLRDQIA